jgi:hypothetical protein
MFAVFINDNKRFEFRDSHANSSIAIPGQKLDPNYTKPHEKEL